MNGEKLKPKDLEVIGLVELLKYLVESGSSLDCFKPRFETAFDELKIEPVGLLEDVLRMTARTKLPDGSRLIENQGALNMLRQVVRFEEPEGFNALVGEVKKAGGLEYIQPL